MRWMNLEPITQSKISQKEKNKYRMLTHTQNLAQLVKNLPAMQETQLPFLGLEDSLEEEMATHCSILAWRIPWTDKPGRLESVVWQEADTTERLSMPHTHRI